MLDMNRHIVLQDSSQPIHSSGIAKVANGDRIGSTDNTSFTQRQQIETNRQFIQAYKSSMVGSTFSPERLQSMREPVKNVVVPQRNNLQRSNSLSRQNLAVPRRSFAEPSGGKFDPYA